MYNTNETVKKGVLWVPLARGMMGKLGGASLTLVLSFTHPSQRPEAAVPARGYVV
jgi:hypothetical protein